jgi:hypothetical protein
MKAKLSSFAALTICLLFLASGAFAGSIPVNNYSFETLPPGGLPFLCGGSCAYSIGPIPGWNDSGTAGQWITGGFAGNPPAYDGNVLAWTSGGTISQNVTTAVAGQYYTLLIEILHRKDQNMGGVAQITLNGVPVATATGSDGGPGSWNLFTATYTASGTGTLGILLSDNGTGQGNFDDVRFSVPERSNLAMLLGFGIFNLAAVLSFRRKLV